MAKELTRRELYDLVWDRPVTKVAADFGISDVALHKICARHRIPTPGRGYWARRGAGQVVKKVLLRDIRDAGIDRVVIHGSPWRALPAAVKNARAEAQSKSSEVADKQTISSTVVYGEDSPVYTQIQTKVAKGSVGKDGYVRAFESFFVSSTRADRALSLLRSLLSRCQGCGYGCELVDGCLWLNVDAEVITLHLSERTDRVPHVLTDAEQSALARWETEQDRKRRRGEFLSPWDKPRIPEWDQVSNGRLVIEVDRGNKWDGLRRTFADGKQRRLEAMLDAILVGIATCAAAAKARQEEAERRKKEWAEAEAQRRETERKRFLESKRWEFLERQIGLFEQACRIDSFVDSYVSRYPEAELPEPCGKLIQWARHRAEILREAASPKRVMIVLDKHNLMDDSAEISSWIRFD